MAQRKKIKRGLAATQICDVLRREILTLELKPGTPLDETLLSLRFNVSRSPIREALNRLLAERLVETLPNKSTIVTPVDLIQFPNFIEALDIQQRYATRLAARKRTDEDLVQLQKLSQNYQISVENMHPLEIIQSNFEFHFAVGKAGKNPYVTRQYGELLSEARRLLHVHIDYLTTVGKEELLRDQHNDFVEAIAKQDVKAADSIAHAHTMQFHDRFISAQSYRIDEEFDFDPDVSV